MSTTLGSGFRQMEAVSRDIEVDMLAPRADVRQLFDAYRAYTR